jgi:hypothetical protein
MIATGFGKVSELVPPLVTEELSGIASGIFHFSKACDVPRYIKERHLLLCVQQY